MNGYLAKQVGHKDLEPAHFDDVLAAVRVLGGKTKLRFSRYDCIDAVYTAYEGKYYPPASNPSLTLEEHVHHLNENEDFPKLVNAFRAFKRVRSFKTPLVVETSDSAIEEEMRVSPTRSPFQQQAQSPLHMSHLLSVVNESSPDRESQPIMVQPQQSVILIEPLTSLLSQSQSP